MADEPDAVTITLWIQPIAQGVLDELAASVGGPGEAHCGDQLQPHPPPAVPVAPPVPSRTSWRC